MQDAAANIARIDPAQCRLASGRLPIRPDAYAFLVEDIRQNGQLVPGLVRRTPHGDPCRYEIVCGARRHAAIAALRQADPRCANLAFFAAIRPLDDAAAFAAADRDNRHRRDIPDYQRAHEYAAALAAHFGGVQQDMAAAIRIQPSELSRYLSLAALPEPLLAAFGAPHRVTLRHVRPLAPKLKHPPLTHLLTLAADLAREQQRRAAAHRAPLPANTVLRRLLEADAPAAAGPCLPTHTVTDAAGRPIAVGALRPDGAVQLELPGFRRTGHAAALAATAEILRVLCDTGNAWHMPSSLTTEMNNRATQRN